MRDKKQNHDALGFSATAGLRSKGPAWFFGGGFLLNACLTPSRPPEPQPAAPPSATIQSTSSAPLTDAQPDDADNGLTREQIAVVIRDGSGRVVDCIERVSAQSGRRATGAIQLAWHVSEQGDVSSVRVVQSSLTHRELEGCLIERVREFRFPTAAKPSDVRKKLVIE